MSMAGKKILALSCMLSEDMLMQDCHARKREGFAAVI